MPNFSVCVLSGWRDSYRTTRSSWRSRMSRRNASSRGRRLKPSRERKTGRGRRRRGRRRRNWLPRRRRGSWRRLEAVARRRQRPTSDDWVASPETMLVFNHLVEYVRLVHNDLRIKEQHSLHSNWAQSFSCVPFYLGLAVNSGVIICRSGCFLAQWWTFL